MPNLRPIAALGALFILTSCAAPAAGFGMPLDNASSRPMLLTFGLYVTPDPAHNPIDPPERFEGFHSALDFEVFESELKKEVPVYAVCDGKVLVSEFAEGYGGVLIQSCRHDGEDITVLYGHLTRDSMPAAGADVRKGDRIGILGEARSADSDGNRKHLHLGMHKGKAIDLRGYVQTAQELNAFLDPAAVLGLPLHPWPRSD
jgi:murein DD-endopeptidase MepM/ murein hydrolase activator NlpD